MMELLPLVTMPVESYQRHNSEWGYRAGKRSFVATPRGST